MWAPLEALEPLWLKERRWKKRQTKRRAEALKVHQELQRIRREHGNVAIRTASVAGGALVGLVIGGAAWPVWWPMWTAWAYLAAGTALGIAIVELAWRRLR